MRERHLHYRFSGIFFFMYFGLGSLLPLLSVYYESIGFNGLEIGALSSLRSVMAVIAPPLWGMLSDHGGRHKYFFSVTLIMSMLVGIIMPFTQSFLIFALIFAVFNLFQVGINPMGDSLTLYTPIPFGKIRKFGAYGFAIASLFTAYMADLFSIYAIFVFFVLASGLAFLLVRPLDISTQKTSHQLFPELKLLIKDKGFLVFLLYTLLIGSAVVNQNTFFGLLFRSYGANNTLIGLAFFLFAISEAPFIQLAGKMIRRFGLFNVLLFTTALSILRWSIYAFVPSIALILILFFLQGLTFGVFFAAAVHFIKVTVSPKIRSTAITLYSSMSLGIGGVIGSFIGGYLYDSFNIQAVYIFLSLTAFLALLVLIVMKWGIYGNHLDDRHSD